MLLPCNGDYFYIKDKVSIGNNSGKSVKEKKWQYMYALESTHC